MTPASGGAKILVIEDEPKLLRFLRAALGAHGYQVAEAATGKDGLRQAALAPPDLVILDLGLPDLDGLEVTRQLREWTAVPIVVLSARFAENDKIAALDAGADDFITKPFGVGELAARIRVALRHARGPKGSESAVFESEGLRVDLVRRVVTLDGKEIKLTRTEYRLLTLLVQHAGKVLTHEKILEELWGPQHVHDTQYLRVYMGQLRRKLEENPARPRRLLTESGVGYRLSAE